MKNEERIGEDSSCFKGIKGFRSKEKGVDENPSSSTPSPSLKLKQTIKTKHLYLRNQSQAVCTQGQFLRDPPRLLPLLHLHHPYLIFVEMGDRKFRQ